MIRGAKDFWAGAIYLFFGASAIWIARDYSMGTALKMGPAYFPSLLGGLLLLIGAISIGRSFFTKGTPIGAFSARGLAFVIVSVVFFGLTVRGLGLAAALPILVMVSALGSTRFRWQPALLMAVGLTIFCVLVFLKGLGIPLPLLGPWLGGS